jgi:hypothetical protein
MEKVEIPTEDNIFYLEVLKLDSSALVIITDNQRRLENFSLVIQNRFVHFT